jgi:nitrogen regulatory protein P-II 2
MQLIPLKCITIVAESILRDRLTGDLTRLGASGFTIVEARGEGSRHLRSGELPGENVRIETIVSPPVADRILQLLADEYFHDYAVIGYIADVSVIRGEKYV